VTPAEAAAAIAMAELLERRLARERAIAPDILIRAVKVDHTTSTGQQRVKIQMDSGAWLIADVSPSQILTPNGAP
jgi:hypothetical protein